MAKKIYIKERHNKQIEEQLRKFFKTVYGRKYGENTKDDSVFRYDPFDEGNKKANLLFTATAWSKMCGLVSICDKEVGWHGIVERKNKNTFMLSDILVFPQRVTAVTVDPDQSDYEKWINNLPDDVFNCCRFHGHSHVNMGVSPSSVDIAYRNKIIDTLGTAGDAFYIFLIINKKLKMDVEIFDIKNNLLYQDGDICKEVVLDGNEKLTQFLKQAKSQIKTDIKRNPPTVKVPTMGTKDYKIAPITSYFDDVLMPFDENNSNMEGH